MDIKAYFQNGFMHFQGDSSYPRYFVSHVHMMTLSTIMDTALVYTLDMIHCGSGNAYVHPNIPTMCFHVGIVHFNLLFLLTTACRILFAHIVEKIDATISGDS